ncbi:hypothetical protein [Aestuariivita boseongensis]|uniref:hypothetical protein n=1 Tax=Aestuariivita boseongensis TaxID=1470562 RepID=UPI0006835A33|nr:hypothetical protein [Aestuariivita boseongensis]
MPKLEVPSKLYGKYKKMIEEEQQVEAFRKAFESAVAGIKRDSKDWSDFQKKVANYQPEDDQTAKNLGFKAKKEGKYLLIKKKDSTPL